MEEKLISEKYPKAISIEGTKKIVNQMEKCICKINWSDENKGTGFFCIINYNNKDIPVMMTNYHAIDYNYIKEKKKIEITLNDDTETREISLMKRIIYISEEYDILYFSISYPSKESIFISITS